MNLRNVLLLFLLGFTVGLSGCSKKGADKVIGKWKAVDFANQQMKEMQVEVTYEFTKDKIINEGTVHGEPLPRMEIPYTVKTSIGDTIVLEGTHPQSNMKGEFKIVVDGNKMNMVDPGQTVITLEKQ